MSTFADQINTQSDLLKEFWRKGLHDLFSADLGIVTEAFDSNKRSVTVKPMTARLVQAPDGSYQEEIPTEIYDVPCIIPASGEFQMTLPINVGDVCLLIFTDYDTQSIRATGQPSSPGDSRPHQHANAVAIFGVFENSKPLIAYRNDAIEFGKRDGSFRVAVTAANTMEVGGAIDAAAKASIVDAVVSHMNSFITTIHAPHTHTTSTGLSGPPSLIGTAYGGGSSASAMLKVGG